MTAVFQILVDPDAYSRHGTWAAVLLFLMVYGSGSSSVDHWQSMRLGGNCHYLEGLDMTRLETGGVGAATRMPTVATFAGRPGIESELPLLRRRLIRHARMAVRNPELAEDLVQDTLIAVVQGHGRHRGASSLATWATAILKNKIADWYRSPDRRCMVLQEALDERLQVDIDALYDANGSHAQRLPAWQQPDNHVERHQMMAILERCVGCLPQQTGRVFMMREWLGFENTEISDSLGLSVDNCRTILHRARSALRVCMQRDWIERKISI